MTRTRKLAPRVVTAEDNRRRHQARLNLEVTLRAYVRVIVEDEIEAIVDEKLADLRGRFE